MCGVSVGAEGGCVIVGTEGCVCAMCVVSVVYVSVWCVYVWFVCVVCV